MSGNVKIVLWIVLLVAVLGGLYYWYSSTKPVTTPATQTADTTGTPAAPTGPTLPTGADTSDAALVQDVTSVDADMSAMTTDTATIDSGLNDKAVAQ